MTSQESAQEPRLLLTEGGQFWGSLTGLVGLQRQIGDTQLALSGITLAAGEDGQRLLGSLEPLRQPLSSEQLRDNDELLWLGAGAINRWALEIRSQQLHAELNSGIAELTHEHTRRALRITSTTERPLPLRRKYYNLMAGEWLEPKHQLPRQTFEGTFDWVEIGNSQSHLAMSRRMDLINFSKYFLELPCTPEQAASVNVEFSGRVPRR